MIRFFKHFWDAIKGLKRNFLMGSVAISSVGLTLTLLGLFAVLILNAQQLTRGVEGNVKISSHLVPDSTDAQEELKNAQGQLVKNPDYHKVYDQIKSLPNVTEVAFSSKDEQLQDLIATMGEEWKTFEQDNPLSDVYVVSVASPDAVDAVATAIEGISGVEDVAYGGTETEALFSLIDRGRIWGAAVTGLIVLVAIFFIANTIRLTILSRRQEIQIMRLVGATSSYIRGPFFIEGALIGFLGSLLPSLVTYLAYLWAYQQYNPGLLDSGLSLYQPHPLLFFVMGGLVLTGILLGSLGASLSVNKYLKF